MELQNHRKYSIATSLLRDLLRNAEGKEINLKVLTDALRTWQNDGISAITGERMNSVELENFAREVIELFTGLRDEPDNVDYFTKRCYQFLLWRSYSKGFEIGKHAMRRYYDTGKRVGLEKDEVFAMVLHITGVITAAMTPKQK